MKNIFLLLATLITVSCNKSHIENFENTDITNTAKNHAIKTPTRRQTQPISYELINNMSMENAVRDYPPIAAETFILGKEGGFITEFRTGLLDIFKADEIKKNNITLKEITWKINTKQNLTVWYQEKNTLWIPIDHLIWDNDTEF